MWERTLDTKWYKLVQLQILEKGNFSRNVLRKGGRVSWGVKNLSLVTERNWLNHCLLLGLHHLSHQSTTHSIVRTSSPAAIECWKLITLWYVVRPQRQKVHTGKRKYLFPRISTSLFPDLGPVSGAVNHQLSSHLHRSPETWPFWSWLADCLARNQTSWIFSFFNVNSFFRSADRSLSTSMHVLLSLSLFLNSKQNQHELINVREWGLLVQNTLVTVGMLVQD